MKLTTLTVYRGTGPIAGQTVIESGVYAQIDQQSLDMMQFDKGASPFDWFDIQAWSIQPILRNDHLVDTDGLVYTVDSRVEPFPDGHSEFSAFVPVGS